jgi:excisionase family DNA binding protein
MADEEYLTPAQLAEELNVTDVTVRRWIDRGHLPAAKAGPRRWMIRRSDVNRFLAAGPLEGSSPVASDAGATEDPSFIDHVVRPDER